jgi:hypothetical protein
VTGGRPFMTVGWVVGTAAIVSAVILALVAWAAASWWNERCRQRRRAWFRAIDDHRLSGLRLVQSHGDQYRYIFVSPGLAQDLESLSHVPGTVVRSKNEPTAPVRNHDLVELCEIVRAAENHDLLSVAG